MKSCRKRQVERRGDEVLHRCINKNAEAHKNPVDASICNVCPVRRAMSESNKRKQPPGQLPVIQTDGWATCEFRYRQGAEPTCGVTGLGVTKEICGRCAKETKDETPNMLQKVMNYSAAVRRWVAAGRPERTDAEIEKIYNEHCSGCSLFVNGVCNSCGCPASKDQPALRNKLRMATEECPLGRFPAKV